MPNRTISAGQRYTFERFDKIIYIHFSNDAILIRCFTSVNDLQRNWHVCLAWLAKTDYHLGAYPVAEILLRQLPDKNFLLLIECLIGQAEMDNKPEKALEAVQLCAELLPTVSAEQQTEVIYLLARYELL